MSDKPMTLAEHQRKAGQSTSPLKKLKSAQNLANWREKEKLRKEAEKAKENGDEKN